MRTKWKLGLNGLSRLLDCILLAEKGNLLVHRVIVGVLFKFQTRCVLKVLDLHAFHMTHVNKSQHLA